MIVLVAVSTARAAEEESAGALSVRSLRDPEIRALLESTPAGMVMAPDAHRRRRFRGEGPGRRFNAAKTGVSFASQSFLGSNEQRGEGICRRPGRACLVAQLFEGPAELS